jgi:hypothetical protein
MASRTAPASHRADGLTEIGVPESADAYVDRDERRGHRTRQRHGRDSRCSGHPCSQVRDWRKRLSQFTAGFARWWLAVYAAVPAVIVGALPKTLASAHNGGSTM